MEEQGVVEPVLPFIWEGALYVLLIEETVVPVAAAESFCKTLVLAGSADTKHVAEQTALCMMQLGQRLDKARRNQGLSLIHISEPTRPY